VLVAHLQKYAARLQLFDQSAAIHVGIALEEAISNAVYHGNLELRSDLREDGSDIYHRLAEERRQRLPYANRRVHVCARLSRAEAVFIVQDQGPGFDPAELRDPREPCNIHKISGRGLLLIRSFMDDVQYNSTGNEVTMRKRRTRLGGNLCEF
jgi:anti-sigma regulatory factor (Ser/Thr protein kinase)